MFFNVRFLNLFTQIVFFQFFWYWHNYIDSFALFWQVKSAVNLAFRMVSQIYDKNLQFSYFLMIFWNLGMHTPTDENLSFLREKRHFSFQIHLKIAIIFTICSSISHHKCCFSRCFWTFVCFFVLFFSSLNICMTYLTLFHGFYRLNQQSFRLSGWSVRIMVEFLAFFLFFSAATFIGKYRMCPLHPLFRGVHLFLG